MRRAEQVPILFNPSCFCGYRYRCVFVFAFVVEVVDVVVVFVPVGRWVVFVFVVCLGFGCCSPNIPQVSFRFYLSVVKVVTIAAALLSLLHGCPVAPHHSHNILSAGSVVVPCLLARCCLASTPQQSNSRLTTHNATKQQDAQCTTVTTRHKSETVRAQRRTVTNLNPIQLINFQGQAPERDHPC